MPDTFMFHQKEYIYNSKLTKLNLQSNKWNFILCLLSAK